MACEGGGGGHLGPNRSPSPPISGGCEQLAEVEETLEVVTRGHQGPSEADFCLEDALFFVFTHERSQFPGSYPKPRRWGLGSYE